MSDKVYIIESKALAIAISFIIDEDFYTYDDRYVKDKKIYSFLKTEKFKKALKTILDLKDEFKNN